jgi:hypothetical protein
MSSLPAVVPNSASISSNETFAVSGTKYVDHKYPNKQHTANMTKVRLTKRKEKLVSLRRSKLRKLTKQIAPSIQA